MQTEGETDTGSDDNSNVKTSKRVQIATNSPETNKNLFHVDDEKEWTKSYEDEARDMKRQLKHYITESNIHDIHGLPQILNISPSDLESGAETIDNDADDSTANILFV